MVSKIAIFTVAEARAKTCPFTFTIPEIPRPNGGVREGGPWPCSGNECMAWRWYTTNIAGPTGDLEPNGETYGYCGLAGSPKPI